MVGGAAILVLWSALDVLSATAQVPQISHPVTDLAGVLSPADEEGIARELVSHREGTGVQLAVLIVDSTKPQSIDDYAQAVFDRWGGGSKERDDGALFVLALSDRRSRLHLGYGLEAVIPDAVAKRMLDGQRPWLVAKDYAGATRELVRSVRARTDHLSPGEPIAPPFGARAWLSAVIIAVAIGLGIWWAIAFKRGWRAYKRHPKGRLHVKKPWRARFGIACAFLVRQRPVYIALGALVLGQLVLALAVSSGHGYIAPYSLLYWNFIIAGWLIRGTSKFVSIPVGIFAGGILVLALLGSGGPPYADASVLFETVLGALGLFWGANIIIIPGIAGGMSGGGGGSYSSSYSSSSSSYSYSSSSSSYSSSSYSGGGGSSGGGGASSSW
jgi:uncharacterized protein